MTKAPEIDDNLLASLRQIGRQINAVIEYLEPHELRENRVLYAKFVTSVISLVITTMPAASRYDLYEMVDYAMEAAHSGQAQFN